MEPDYPISVIEVGNYPWAEDFTTDLKLVFGFIQNADDKEKLQAFAQREKQGFAELAEDAYDLIGAMTNTKELDRIKKVRWISGRQYFRQKCNLKYCICIYILV